MVDCLSLLGLHLVKVAILRNDLTSLPLELFTRLAKVCVPAAACARAPVHVQNAHA